MKDFPVKANPMKGLSVKAMPCRQACIVWAFPEVTDVKLKDSREWKFILCVKYTPEWFLNLATWLVKISRRSPHLRALWRHDAPKIKGYDETVNWTFDDWKNMSGHWDGQDTFRIFLSTEIVTSPRMLTNWPQTAEHGAYSLQMDMLRHSTRSHCNIHVHSSIRTERTENKYTQNDIVTNARCSTWVWFATRAKPRTGISAHNQCNLIMMTQYRQIVW